MTIKELRTMTGLSQSKFGARFGIPVGNIQHWEHNISTPPDYVPGMIEKIIGLEERLKEVEGRTDGQYRF